MIEVETRVGTVADLHGLDPFAGAEPVTPAVWWCRPTDDAIVLGSRQSHELLDAAACERAGLSIVRRRSGGGAVLMRRASLHWIDSASLSCLIRTQTRLQPLGGEQVLAAPGALVTKTFKTLGMDRIFRTFPDVEQARRYLDG